MNPIDYMSDQVTDYVEALPKCKTLDDLKALLIGFHTIAPDALAQCPRDEKEFKLFMLGLKKERRGKFAGPDFMERYGAVLMPALMIRISSIANQYGAPWGLVFIRLRDAGRIQFDNTGVAQWVEPEERKP